VLVLAIIAGIASYVPARAVTRVEPLLALRQE
jgi:ABC-type antimicrobial peptide transport system permease subunit